jgi:virginiamycin B lyase
MQVQARFALGLSGLLTFAWGCSGGGNVPSTPPSLSQSAASAAREQIKIREFSDLPNCPSSCLSNYFPSAITKGPDGALWVTDDIDQDAGSDAIARITTSGKHTATFYYQNYVSPSLADIVTGPDGALWITDSGDGLILRMTTNGTFTPYTLNSAGPEGIVSGPDRALWFVENYYRGASVGRITTSGQITLFTKGISSGAALQDITVGPDGALWFTETIGDRIGRITKRGKITEYSAGITPGSRPYSIAAGPDGALWFTEIAGGRIGRITTAGKVTEYSQGITPTEGPVDLAAGSDGAMWFTEYESLRSYQVAASKIGRVTMSGKITEFSKIDPTSAPTTIVQGPDGNMWFVEMDTDRSGRVTL